MQPPHTFTELPSAREHFDAIQEQLAGRSPLLVLDYDGTLTPIVSQPEDAHLGEDMRELLRRLAATIRVAVVSGRDLRDVRGRVGLPELYYAGSHGFELSGPGGLYFEYEAGREVLPILDRAEATLQKRLRVIGGVRIERKRFAIAIHYRNVAAEDEEAVLEKAGKVLRGFPRLKKGLGKKIVEFKPKLDWHKGKTVGWLLDHLKTAGQELAPLYIGDDITDEDAFRQIREDGGIGILVGDHGAPTQAHYRLAGVGEVKIFLERLLAR